MCQTPALPSRLANMKDSTERTREQLRGILAWRHRRLGSGDEVVVGNFGEAPEVPVGR